MRAGAVHAAERRPVRAPVQRVHARPQSARVHGLDDARPAPAGLRKCLFLNSESARLCIRVSQKRFRRARAENVDR